MAEQPDQPRWKAVGPCTGAAGQPYRALLTPSSEYQLADGRAVVLRRAGPGDVPAITRLYLELSAESFSRRFNPDPPAPTRVAQLASLGNGAACLVASPPHRLAR